MTERRHAQLGGARARLLVVRKYPRCSKDVPVWVPAARAIESAAEAASARDAVWRLVGAACARSSSSALDPRARELADADDDDDAEGAPSDAEPGRGPARAIELRDSYFHAPIQRRSHLYRVWFDGNVTNEQAKYLEQRIRGRVRRCGPRYGIELRES